MQLCSQESLFTRNSLPLKSVWHWDDGRSYFQKHLALDPNTGTSVGSFRKYDHLSFQ